MEWIIYTRSHLPCFLSLFTFPRCRARHYDFAIQARGEVPLVDKLNTVEAAEAYLKPYLFDEVGDAADDSHIDTDAAGANSDAGARADNDDAGAGAGAGLVTDDADNGPPNENDNDNDDADDDDDVGARDDEHYGSESDSNVDFARDSDLFDSSSRVLGDLFEGGGSAPIEDNDGSVVSEDA